MTGELLGEYGRRRVVRTIVAENWNGAGSMSKDLAVNGHSSMSQHHITIAGSTDTTLGIVTVRMRPTGMTRFVTVGIDSINIGNADGSASFVVNGFYDAITVTTQSGISVGTLTVNIASVGEHLGAMPVPGSREHGRKKVINNVIAQGWGGTLMAGGNAIGAEGMALHHFVLSCSSVPTAGIVLIQGIPVGSNNYCNVAQPQSLTGSGTINLFVAGFYSAFRILVDTAIVGGGTIDARVASCGEDLNVSVLLPGTGGALATGGTRKQFWRGDKGWSDTLTGDGSVPLNLFAYGGNPQINGRNTGGTEQTPSATTNGAVLLSLNGTGYGSSLLTATRVSMNFSAAAAWTGTSQPTYVLWSTTRINGVSATPGMWLNAQQNLVVGSINVTGIQGDSALFPNDGSAGGVATTHTGNSLFYARSLASGQFIGAASSGTLNAPGATAAVTVVELLASTYGGTTWAYPGAVQLVSTQTHSESARGTDCVVSLTPEGSTTRAEKFRVKGDGRVFGKALHNNANAVTGTTDQYIASGTYTPTATAGANSAAVTALGAQWTRVGNVVTVSGVVQCDPTAADSVTIFTLSLPIPSNFTSFTQLSGVAVMAAAVPAPWVAVQVTGDATNDVASFGFNSGADLNNRNITYTYTYQVL